jgi:DNA-binding beta-propeller fold protein YncE
VIDCCQHKYLRSIPNVTGVAGVLVSDEKGMVFTSNRGENTVGIFSHGEDQDLQKIKVGGKPNGLAFNYSSNMLLAANVPKPNSREAATVSIVDMTQKTMTADIPVPGRTRWAVFDPESERFYVNIADPSQIAFLDAKDPDGLAGSYQIPAVGPHGLDLDPRGRRLFCACDGGRLYIIDLETEKVSKVSELAGPPDVIFYNSQFGHLYVTIGHPSVIQIFDTNTLKEVQVVKTETGTHTIGFNQETNRVYAFMPESHRASIYEEV